MFKKIFNWFKSFFSNPSPKTILIMQSAGSILDIGGLRHNRRKYNRNRYKTNKEAFEADQEALRGDFEKVGQDMWKAIDKINKGM